MHYGTRVRSQTRAATVILLRYCDDLLLKTGIKKSSRFKNDENDVQPFYEICSF